jgi:uncharacterized protein DUF1236
MEISMKQFAALAIAVLLSTGAAHAQTTTITTGAAPTDSVIIAPENRTRIHQYVVENHVAPVELRAQIAVGATLPADVELQTVPADWGPTVTKYRYVYSNDRVVLVEPSSRRVVQIVE